MIDLGLDSFIKDNAGTIHAQLTATLIEDLKSLETLRTKYFQPSLGITKKEKLKEEYFVELDKIALDINESHDEGLKKIAQRLKEWNPFDDSKFSPFFSPTWMFGIDKGFDLIIGNPPYIGQKNNNEKFKAVKESPLGRKFHQRRMDYFYFFIHKGLDFLNANGCLCLITTNYYFTATYADKLRGDIKSRSSILKIINFNELKLFESALGQHNSIILLRKPFDKTTIANTTAVLNADGLDLEILRDVLKGIYSEAVYSQKDNAKIYDSQNGNIQIDLTESSNSDF